MDSIVANIRLLVCVIAGIVLLSAQSLAQQAPDTGVSQSDVEARMAEAQDSTDLDAESRDELNGLYREALRFIEAQRSHDAAAKTFAEARVDAPAEIDRLRIENDERNFDAADVVLDLPADVDTLTIGQRVQREKIPSA